MSPSTPGRRLTATLTLAALTAIATSSLGLPAQAQGSLGALSPNVAISSGAVDTLITASAPIGITLSGPVSVTATNCTVAPYAGYAVEDITLVDPSTVTFLAPALSKRTCQFNISSSAGSFVTETLAWQSSGIATTTLSSIVNNALPAGQASTIVVNAGIGDPDGTGADKTGLTGAKSLTVTCNTTTYNATNLTVLSPTAMAASLPAMPATINKGAGKQDPCSVEVTLASGNVINSTSVPAPSGIRVYNQPASVNLTPDNGSENQTKANAQTVTLSGQGLSGASGVTFQYCSPGYVQAVYNATNLTDVSEGLKVTAPLGVPASVCTVVVTLKSGRTVMSSPLTGGGFTFNTPYQGPITVTITNTQTNGTPRSGTPDDSLWLNLLADPTGGGAVNAPTSSGNAMAGLNDKTLTGVKFTDLTTYNAATSTATITLTPPLVSGNLYLSNSDLTGNPPDPTTTDARYTFTEFTYNDSGFDFDLTLIDQIGYTLSTDLLRGDGSVINGSYRDTGCLVDIVNDISLTGANMNPTSAASNPGIMRYSGTAPTSTPADGTWTLADLAQNPNWSGIIGAAKDAENYPSVQTYITSFKAGTQLTINDILGDKTYGGVFNYTATLGTNGLWTLEGTVANGKTGPTLSVEHAGLAGPGTKGGTGYQVYEQDGPFKVTFNGSTYTWSSGGTVPVALTNTVKTIYRDFVTAFSYGYWGSAKYPGNTTGPADNQQFVTNPVTGAYQNAQPDYGPGTKNGYAWNVYDAIIRSRSNINGTGSPVPSGAYAMPYSDTYVPSDLSPNQQHIDATHWNIALGDPTGCGDSLTLVKRAITPNTQTVRVNTGTPVATATYQVSGFAKPPVFSVTPALPAGLTLNPANGTITGTPTKAQPASTYTVTATGKRGSATATVTIAIGTPPVPAPVVPPVTPLPVCPPHSWWDPTIGECVEPA